MRESLTQELLILDYVSQMLLFPLFVPHPLKHREESFFVSTFCQCKLVTLLRGKIHIKLILKWKEVESNLDVVNRNYCTSEEALNGRGIVRSRSQQTYVQKASVQTCCYCLRLCSTAKPSLTKRASGGVWTKIGALWSIAYLTWFWPAVLVIRFNTGCGTCFFPI